MKLTISMALTAALATASPVDAKVVKRRASSVPPAVKAPRMSDADMLAGALLLNTIREGENPHEACRRSDFKTLALVLAKMEGRLAIQKNEFETDTEFAQRSATLASKINALGDIIVCQPLNDNPDAPFTYNADSQAFSGTFRDKQNVWRDIKQLRSYVSSTAMGAKARVQSSLEMEYDVEYVDSVRLKESSCFTGYYFSRTYTVPVSREQAPSFKSSGYLYVVGTLVPPFVKTSDTPGKPTLTDPYDVYNRTTALTIDPRVVGVVSASGNRPFQCDLSARPKPLAALAADLSQTSTSMLSSALARLGRDPRDMEALVDAGKASLAAGDVDAASGFFRRAQIISPHDAAVKTGLARAMVQNNDPYRAIPLFKEVEQAGAFDAAAAADMGLANDLACDNATAQRYYRQSLSLSNDEEVAKRLAVSLAISGDSSGAQTTLLPLLRQQNKGAWRARTFVLAIAGQIDESIRTARTILPTDLSEGLSPYLRYRPQLTHAQQAAAVNLGRFPRASEIGRDDPRAAQLASSKQIPGRSAAWDIAAPLRAAQAARQVPLSEGDEKYRNLMRSWMSLESWSQSK